MESIYAKYASTALIIAWCLIDVSDQKGKIKCACPKISIFVVLFFYLKLDSNL